MTAAAAAPIVNDRREIFGWVMYDWANSVFSTTVYTVLLGPYLIALAESAVGKNGYVLPGVSAESLFPFSISLSVFLQVFFLPVLGAIADYTHLKKRLMQVFCYIGVAATCLMFFVTSGGYLFGALLFIIANLCFGGSIVLYNSYLADITTEDQRDRVSSQGFAWGYMGGGLLLLLNLLLFQFGPRLGIDRGMAVRLSLLSAGVWWGGFSLVTFSRLRQRAPTAPPPPGRSLLSVGFIELGNTFRELARLPHTLKYLIGYLFYNDGIQTVIGLASVFLAAELFTARGLEVDNSFLIELILMVQFVAFFGALLFGKIAVRFGTKRAILLSLLIWFGVVVYAYGFLNTMLDAWIMGAVLALALGGSQALSRSLYSRMVPIKREAAFFGLYEISERGTSWMGPLIFGIVRDVTHSYRQAILSVLVLLVVGAVVLALTNTTQAVIESGNVPAAEDMVGTASVVV